MTETAEMIDPMTGGIIDQKVVTRSLDPTGHGRARWAIRWKPALNAFAIAFEGRIK